jgi:hypothetical protein
MAASTYRSMSSGYQFRELAPTCASSLVVSAKHRSGDHLKHALFFQRIPEGN